MNDDTNNANTDASNGAEHENDIIIDGSLDAEAKLKALEEQNKKLFERAKKAEGFVKNDEGHWIKKVTPQPKREEITSSTVSTEDERFELRMQGYSKEDTNFIMANGGAKILEDKTSLVSIAIKAKRDQTKAEDASSKLNDKTGLSEVERKYTPEQLKAMTPKELEKILPHAQ